MKLSKKQLDELVKQGNVKVVADPKKLFSDGYVIVKDAHIKRVKGENTRIIESLLASDAGKKKAPKKKAVIPDHERALFKGWQLAEYKAKYAHMAEHLRPKPKGKTWTRYSNFLEEAIQQWARTFKYTANKISTQGTYRPGIGFTFGGATKGVEDLQLFIQGKMYALEVKVGKDVQSDAQKARQKALEAQGFGYIIIANLEQFANWAKRFE